MTALPEYWNYKELWWRMVRSRNHAMLGHVKEWMTRSILGINPNSPGYRYISIKPYIQFGMKEAKGSMTCPYGKIEVHWNCDDTEKTLKMKVTIPVGTTADVFVPKLAGNTIIMDGQYIDASITNDSAYFEMKNIGSGTYIFITAV